VASEGVIGSDGDRELLRVLFLTDVEGSTRQWQRDPTGMSSALDVLDRVVESAVVSDGGEIVRSRGEGDSHFVVFASAASAVRSAERLQLLLSEADWPEDLALRVRVAIHAGDLTVRNGAFDGVAINHAARLRATSHGGQVVVSRAIVDLASPGLDARLSFESLGRHRVRDAPGWTEIFQLCGPSLTSSFPPLVTLDTGLPPIAAIVALDAVGWSRVMDRSSPDEERTLWRTVVELFASCFSSSGGQYLKQLGDGCLALFADPDDALAFARRARDDAHQHGIAFRSALHFGRIEFVREEPIGRAIEVTFALQDKAPTDRIALSPAAATFISPADDLVIIEP
jgi:class 3 adenylate cyclase